MNMSLDPAPGASALGRLAARFGIALDFVDAHGRPVTTRPETHQRLLASMGVVADDETAALAALEALDEADAARAMPPVVVLRSEGDACTVNVRVPPGTRTLRWLIQLENGSTLEGTAELHDDAFHEGAARHRLLRALALPQLPYGYHHLELPELGATTTLIVSPGKCWLPEKLGTGGWGIAVQLYLLRSETNWGIGDFSDLARLVELAGQRGCDVIGLNPLHQMFLDDPEQASPYSPATRLFLNPLYIDVLAVPEYRQCQEAREIVESARFQAAISQARAAPLVDYTSVTALKLEALRAVFQSFVSAPADARQQAFERFCAEKGGSLARASLFQVLRQQLSHATPEGRDWRNWPADLQNPASEAARAFAAQNGDEISFQNWLQFLADEQLGHAAQAAERTGMSIGLYRDLAVGCDRWGAETWANPVAFLERATVGAPPDILNPAGQNWGLPPFDPAALRREAYRSFSELIRANMHHAGGLRIDHVMGLARLYCIPEGASSAEGAFVSYPLDDLIGVLALESQRQKCLVVGEDLGTVPSGFREKLAAANVLSYRVLFFEQDIHTGVYVPPHEYPQLALAVTGSHDLPTLLAWWEGRDLVVKEKLGLYPTDEETAAQRERRQRDRRTLIDAFAGAGLLAEVPALESISAAQFTRLAHAFLALTPSALLATQLDDLTADTEPVNVPGTSTEWPNWRRKYRLTLDMLAADETAWSLTAPLTRRSETTSLRSGRPIMV